MNEESLKGLLLLFLPKSDLHAVKQILQYI